MNPHRCHRLWTIKFARRIAIGAQGNAGVVQAGLHQAAKLQCLGIDVQDMPRGMQDANRPRLRNAVQIGPGDAFVVHINRVQRPARQGRVGIGHFDFCLFQPVQDRVNRARAFPHLAVGVRAIKIAAIDIAPQCTFHRMGMPFDQAGHQDLVRKGFVQLVLPPGGQLFQIAHPQDSPVAHGHMAGNRPVAIHRDDFSGRIDCGVAHWCIPCLQNEFRGCPPA